MVRVTCIYVQKLGAQKPKIINVNASLFFFQEKKTVVLLTLHNLSIFSFAAGF